MNLDYQKMLENPVRKLFPFPFYPNKSIQGGAPKIAFSWFITPISLWFIILITIVFMGFISQLTSLGGPTLYQKPFFFWTFDPDESCSQAPVFSALRPPTLTCGAVPIDLGERGHSAEISCGQLGIYIMDPSTFLGSGTGV